MSMDYSSGDKTYHVEQNSMIASNGMDGVMTGLAVTAQGTPSMVLDISAGECHVDNEVYTESSATTVTIGTADATYARIDLVCYDVSASAAVVVEGDAGTLPQPPNIPDGDLLLALINIPAADTTISSDQITDERIFIKPIGIYMTASDVLMNSDDTEEYKYGQNYEVEKELDPIILNLHSNDSEFRIKFDLKTSAAGNTVYGRIYRNGVAVGTERSSTSTTYATHSEDIIGWSEYDLIQLYTYSDAMGVQPYVRNFRVYGDIEHKSVFGW